MNSFLLVLAFFINLIPFALGMAFIGTCIWAVVHVVKHPHDPYD